VRTPRLAVVAGLAAFLLVAGCGGDGNESMEFKKTDTAQFDAMKDMMTKNVKSKNYKGDTKGGTAAETK
jgi:hypothetical protein